MEGRDRLETALASDHISAGCSRNFMYLSEEAIFKNSDRITRIRALNGQRIKKQQSELTTVESIPARDWCKVYKGPPSVHPNLDREEGPISSCISHGEPLFWQLGICTRQDVQSWREVGRATNTAFAW